MKRFPILLVALVVGAGLATIYARLAPPGQIEVTTDSFDVAEAATVPPVLGVIHPTGYPLYTLLGRVATWKASILPGGLEPARVMNLVSALLTGLAGAAAVFLFASAGGAVLATLPAVLLLFVSDTLLPYATVSSVYPLHALLTALVLGTAIAGLGERGAALRLLSAYLGGLLVTHHPSGALVLPGWALLFVAGSLRERRFWRDAPAGLALALVAASVLLFLPIRYAADPPVSPHGGLGSAAALLDYVSGRGFHHLFDFRAAEMWARARTALGWFVRDWTPAGLLLAAWGLVALLRTRPAVGLALLLVAVPNFVFSSAYRLDKVFIYYVPSHLAVGALAAAGLADILRPFHPPLARRVVAAGLTLLVGLLVLPRAVRWDRSRDDRLSRYVSEVFRRAGPDATIVAWDSFYWALQYRQLVHGERTDLTVDYVEGLRPSIEKAVLEGRPAYYVPPTRERRYLRSAYRLVEIPILAPSDTTLQGTFLPATSLVEVIPTVEEPSPLTGFARRFLRTGAWSRGETVGARIAPRAEGTSLVFEGSFETAGNDYAEFVMEPRRMEFARARRLVFSYDRTGAGLLLYLWLKERDPRRYARYRIPLDAGDGRAGAFDLTLPEKRSARFDPSRIATLHWILDDEPDAASGAISLRVRSIRIE